MTSSAGPAVWLISREVLALLSYDQNDASPGFALLIYSKGGLNLKSFKGDRDWTLKAVEVLPGVSVDGGSVVLGSGFGSGKMVVRAVLTGFSGTSVLPDLVALF